MDSLAIALTSGAIIKNYQAINVMKIAGMLAFMQMAMTAFGWFIGSAFVRYIDRYDHWLAFAILFFLGARVIYSGLKGGNEDRPFNPLDFKTMFSLGIATSIDATAVGLSMSFININILAPALMIGIITMIVSSMGVALGCKAGRRCNIKINIIGGVILIIIGCSILAQHTILQNESLVPL
jgi:putative Mn2+ efflux pump MntP